MRSSVSASPARSSVAGNAAHRDPMPHADAPEQAALTRRLAACYTGAVHDVLRAMGRERIVLPPAIKAIAPGTRLAGPVWTVAGHVDHTATRHECLLGW